MMFYSCIFIFIFFKIGTKSADSFISNYVCIFFVLLKGYFANRVFDSLNVATEGAELGLAEMAANKSATHQLTRAIV
jgi:hypothetical protein